MANERAGEHVFALVHRGGGDIIILKVEEGFLATRRDVHVARPVRRQR